MRTVGTTYADRMRRSSCPAGGFSSTFSAGTVAGSGTFFFTTARIPAEDSVVFGMLASRETRALGVAGTRTAQL